MRIKCIFDYCERWKFELYILQTEVVKFRAGEKLNKVDKLYFNSKLLDIV